MRVCRQNRAVQVAGVRESDRVTAVSVSVRLLTKPDECVG